MTVTLGVVAVAFAPQPVTGTDPPGALAAPPQPVTGTDPPGALARSGTEPRLGRPAR